MKLSFTELEPIYNTDYQKNGGDKDDNRIYSDANNTGDLMPIFVVTQDNPNTSMIGY